MRKRERERQQRKRQSKNMQCFVRNVIADTSSMNKVTKAETSVETCPACFDLEYLRMADINTIGIF